MAGSTKLLTSGGGGVILTPASSIASDVTVNIPPVNGTLVNTGSTAQVSQAMLATGVAGNGPAFSAYPSSAQSLSNVTVTKVAFNTKLFDTNSNYDNTTNYRFTPTVAGYYQVNFGLQLSSSNANALITYIYKNGAAANISVQSAATNVIQASFVSGLIYLNGSTDYIEAYTYQASGGSINITLNSAWTFFQASMVRSA